MRLAAGTLERWVCVTQRPATVNPNVALAVRSAPRYACRYLFDAYNMTSTTYGPTNNPSMAAGITTTGQDFENLLQRLLAASVLHESVLAQMETDWSKAPVSPSGDGW